ncbi:MAG: hypothetical protein ACP6IU_11765 [Candidatus Asgardarchaeia archaeon]
MHLTQSWWKKIIIDSNLPRKISITICMMSSCRLLKNLLIFRRFSDSKDSAAFGPLTIVSLSIIEAI